MIPLFTSQQVRNADSYAIGELKIPGSILMENAAISIFNSIIRNFPEISALDKIGIICGKGNNGGDGFTLARHFINSGFEVKVISIGSEKELKGDAKLNFQILKNYDRNRSGIIKFFKNISDLNWLSDCTVIVDAILGTGTKGALKEPLNKIIQKLNDFEAIKIAVDCPTGLDIDSGYGSNIFEADLTVTLAEFKRGLFFGKGYTSSGVIEKGSIGMDSTYFDNLEVEDYLIEPEDAYWNLPPKLMDAHKYSAGKVLVIAGSGALPGASLLTAESALISGSGSVILAFPKSIKSIAQTKLNSIVLHSYNDDGKEFLREENVAELENRIEWADTIIIGPGLGREESTQNAILKILTKFKKKDFVIDADGLFPLGNELYKSLNLRGKVLTPHHGEFSAMLGIETETLQQDLLKYGKEFVGVTGAFLVLKGAPTIIFTPAGESIINSAGNPGMAKFGTGDVLSGVIGSFTAQSGDIDSSLVSAVYLHSLSADLLLKEHTIYGLTATKILENLPTALKFLHESVIHSA